MARSALTGSRIRARRVDIGLRQAALAEACGISASYLNLIEHNRRRIGGKLLIDIARALDIEVAVLSQGADAVLIDGLRAAAADATVRVETERAEEFAGRFPGWARLISEQDGRIESLQQAVETLSDRLAHDPFLSASLHDILSTVAAIRATSAILAEEKDVDPAWQARFHRNLHEDSQRLAEASRSLAAYLDAGGDISKNALSPQDELEHWLERTGYRVAAIEAGHGDTDAAIAEAADALASEASKALARGFLRQYRSDAAALPEAPFLEALAEHGPDPAALSRRFGATIPEVLRRIAVLAGEASLPSVGPAVCDGSGTLIFRKQVDGFPLPRFGSACSLWPLFQALSRPMAPMRHIVDLPGRVPRRFLTYSVAEIRSAAGFDAPPILRSHMLIVPAASDDVEAVTILAGTSCRICPRPDCAARREPSVVADEPSRDL